MKPLSGRVNGSSTRPAGASATLRGNRQPAGWRPRPVPRSYRSASAGRGNDPLGFLSRRGCDHTRSQTLVARAL